MLFLATEGNSTFWILLVCNLMLPYNASNCILNVEEYNLKDRDQQGVRYSLHRAFRPRIFESCRYILPCLYTCILFIHL